jgi:hypothetical protein
MLLSTHVARPLENPLHTPVLGVIDTGVTPLGNSTTTMTCPIRPSPSFRTEKCVLYWLPGLIVRGDTTEVICRSPDGAPANVAVTLRSVLIVTEHDPEPVHAPDQPVNVDPDAGVAVRPTTVPVAKSASHVVGQLMPEGELVTDPDPDPDTVTERWRVVGVPLTVTAPSGPEGAMVKPELFSADAELVNVPGVVPTFAVKCNVPSPAPGTTSGPAHVSVFPLPIVGLAVVIPVVEFATYENVAGSTSDSDDSVTEPVLGLCTVIV